MKPRRIFAVLTFAGASSAGLLSGCSSSAPEASTQASMPHVRRAETWPDATSTARTADAYKRDIALRITEVNSTKIYLGQPQALLRAVIVVKFWIDGNGKLLRSEIVRSNRDSAAEATALSTLRNTAPFPKPASGLLRGGRVELTETWLFNQDGRFQIRSVAEPQLSE